MSSIADIRREYKLRMLTENEVSSDAMEQFTSWWQDAFESQIDEVNAMTLCTVNANGNPDGRIVLLKGYDVHGFSFFTNYESTKGKDLSANPNATLVFFWKEIERQVRIAGVVEKLTDAENDAYYQSRPRGSQLGAWASPQSRPVIDRQVLEQNLIALQKEYGENHIPRPPHWGGYRLLPKTIEFWQGRPNRLHDRLLYQKVNNDWEFVRLAP
ncbi:MAG: pyridoxamine 5'-phosphate oxidase [Bacteroidota bacterium]